jgi:PilZ domain
MSILPNHERRQFGRRTSKLRGTIQLNRRGRCACTILNFSEAGALVVLDEPHALPDTFDLTVDRTGLQVWCQIKHRNGASFGVQFCERLPRPDTFETYRSDRLTYNQLLALATADREGEEFTSQYGHRLVTGAVRPLNTIS